MKNDNEKHLYSDQLIFLNIVFEKEWKYSEGKENKL